LTTEKKSDTLHHLEINELENPDEHFTVVGTVEFEFDCVASLNELTIISGTNKIIFTQEEAKMIRDILNGKADSNIDIFRSRYEYSPYRRISYITTDPSCTKNLSATLYDTDTENNTTSKE
jgi:hypothetical protein